MPGPMGRSDFAHAQGRRFAPLVRLLTRIHARIYRRSSGRLGGKVSGCPVLVLTTTGAVTGVARSVPVIYMADQDRYIVVPSNSGMDRAPGWWKNLQAHPVGEIQIGPRREAVAARVIDGAERAELWDRAMRFNPAWERCQEITSRQLPLVALEPADSTG